MIVHINPFDSAMTHLEVSVLTLVLIAGGGWCENVLFLYPIASPSHKNVGLPLMLGLADRGHNVTVVSSFKTEPHGNIRDILVHDNFDIVPGIDFLALRKKGVLGTLMLDLSYLITFCHKTFENQELMELLEEKFDLVLMDSFANDCLFGFIYKLGAPFIIVAPLPVPSEFAVSTGIRLPPSFVPHFLLPFNHQMTFLERIINFVVVAVMSLRIVPSSLKENEAVYKEHLGEDLPDVLDIANNVSMILTNAHFSLNSPRPTLPDVVEVGAIHCRPGRPLSQDLEDFVSQAQDGFILFSLGSIVKPHELPEATRKVFLNVFSRLKQRVLWKWPHDMKDLPENVRLLKWAPQQDLLAHPNIRLFISHCGLLSTEEAIYHGVPMVSIPVFADQDVNAKRATEAGVAVTVEILDVTEQILDEAIHKVMVDSSYKETAQKMSTYLRDQPQTPKERGIFWAEYVMRHKGAHHLRSAARDLNYLQYHSIDVVAVLLIGVVLIVWVAYFVVKKALSCLRNSCNEDKEKKL